MTLYHIGPVNWKERAEMLRETALKAGNIRLLGAVDDETLRRYISNGDAFVYISDGEGFGLPPIKVLACGINVVVNNLPVSRETIGGKATISDIENFEEAVLRTLNNKSSGEELANFSKKNIP